MPWRLSWSTDAAAFLSRMEKADARRIVAKLEKALENPRHYFKSLSGQDDSKLRVGDYRLVVLILHDSQTVFVEKIGHRKNVYKR